MNRSRRELCKYGAASLVVMGSQVRIAHSSSLSAPGQSGTTRIVRRGNRYELTRDGKPYFIKGVGGDQSLVLLAANGGNSVRTWSPSMDMLKNAHELGISVLVGLTVGRPRQGFNYGDAKQVSRQLERIRADVLRMKDHPALLMWALGNEVELNVDPADRPRLWAALEQLAQLIHAIDGRHPVIVVLAGLEGGKLTELKRACPSIDAVGINAYGSMLQVPEIVAREEWTKPYVVTEFGPRGHWEVQTTFWKARLEDNSTQKEEFYLQAYRHAIADRPQCLGSYAFYWGQKQEKTHTWYGMFLPEGNPTGPLEAMFFAWNGRWPENRYPRIGPGAIQLEAEHAGDAPHVFLPGAHIRSVVDVVHPQGKSVTVRWDVRLDVANAPQHGGDPEETTAAIDGSVLSSQGHRAVLLMPRKPGPYRVFVYVVDPAGNAATANVPVLVRAT